MRKLFLVGSLFVIAIAAVGCATSFIGDAYFPGGARGCFSHCEKVGMTMDSFVLMGEYSTACVCHPKQAAPATGKVAASSSTGGVAASVAVVTQMRAEQAATAGAVGGAVGAGLAY